MIELVAGLCMGAAVGGAFVWWCLRSLIEAAMAWKDFHRENSEQWKERYADLARRHRDLQRHSEIQRQEHDRTS
jgi:hypothetical protein